MPQDLTEKTQEKDLIVLQVLEGNAPTGLNTMQSFVEPHVPALVSIWWAIWIVVLVCMFYRFVLSPLFRNNT